MKQNHQSSFICASILMFSMAQVNAATILTVDISGSSGSFLATDPMNPVSGSLVTPHGNNTAFADFGVLRASSLVNLTETGFDDGANTIAAFSDNILIESDSIPMFRNGTISALIMFSGDMAINFGGLDGGDAVSASTIYNFNLTSKLSPDSSFPITRPVLREAGRLDFDRLVQTLPSSSGTVPPTAIFNVDIPFQFGTDFELSMSLLTAASARLTDTGLQNGFVDSSSDFGSTAIWGGISDIRDSSGNIITDFTLQSGSGTNWLESQAVVPLPPALWLFLTGMIGLFVAGRRDHQ